MIVLLNSSVILEEVKDLQISSKKGLLLCAKSVKKANEFEDTLNKFNIKYQRFGQSTQFAIDCWVISVYDDIIK